MANSVTTKSFRVPNSIIQGLTTATHVPGDPDALNRMTAFQTIILLGLFTFVNAEHPDREARTTPAKLLDVIEVSKSVAHMVERSWNTAEGEQKSKAYQAQRNHPKHMKLVHKTLAGLFAKTVRVRWRKSNGGSSERFVHVLDSFGYEYERSGRPVDLDNLPAGAERVNVGNADRPIWRIGRVQGGRVQFDRAKHVAFRINRELARELAGARGSICFTLLARKVFELFRTLMKSPARMRLALLVLRQTGDTFTRNIRQSTDDLGFDNTHPERALSDLKESLMQLRNLGVINSFSIEGEKLSVSPNRQWHQSSINSVETQGAT